LGASVQVATPLLKGWSLHKEYPFTVKVTAPPNGAGVIVAVKVGCW